MNIRSENFNEVNHYELKSLLIKAIGDMSQSEFAQKAGISKFALNRLINSRNSFPRKTTLFKIAKQAANGVTYSDLLLACGYEVDDISHSLSKGVLNSKDSNSLPSCDNLFPVTVIGYGFNIYCETGLVNFFTNHKETFSHNESEKNIIDNLTHSNIHDLLSDYTGSRVDNMSDSGAFNAVAEIMNRESSIHFSSFTNNDNPNIGSIICDSSNESNASLTNDIIMSTVYKYASELKADNFGIIYHIKYIALPPRLLYNINYDDDGNPSGYDIIPESTVN